MSDPPWNMCSDDDDGDHVTIEDLEYGAPSGTNRGGGGYDRTPPQDLDDDKVEFVSWDAPLVGDPIPDPPIVVISDPDAFDVLQRKVLPTLFERRGADPLRIWVLGCSTGQEAYSMAMSFVEAAEKAPRLPRLQVFATDLNEALLDKARHGLYAKSLAQDLSPERLRRFFVEEQGGYRINKALREMVVFARQNVISDPPFSRLDLIITSALLLPISGVHRPSGASP